MPKRLYVTMIPLGGVVGAGLFVGSGAIPNAAAPKHTIIGGFVNLIVRRLGEATVAEPYCAATGTASRAGAQSPSDKREKPVEWPARTPPVFALPEERGERLTRYEPADSFETPRFSGVRTFMRLPNVRDLANADVAIVGAPFDTGSSFRAGARFGPEGIRSASHLLRPYNPSQGIRIFEHLSVIDYGDVPVVPGFTEESYERITAGLAPIHEAGVVPVALGGDHAVALPALRAAAATHGPLSLVQFDSHADTWDAYFGQKYNHGTVFRRAVEEGLLDPVRSIQVGMRGSLYEPGDLEASRDLGFDLVTTDGVRKFGIGETILRIRERVGDSKVYVSFDVDFVDPAYAPGTGTPEVGGFTSHEAQTFVRGLAGANIVGCDVVEVYPMYDGPGQITSLLAANVAYELLTLIAQRAGDAAVASSS